MAAAPGCQKVIENAIRPNETQGENQGTHQVVRDTAQCAGGFGQHGRHHITEVIIGNGIARKPGVVRREGGRSHDGVDQGQFHGLLATVDFDVGIGGAHKSPGCKSQEEQELNQHDHANMRPEPIPQGLARFFLAQSEPGTYRQHKQSQQQPAAVILDKAQGSHHPKNVGPNQ